MSKQIGIVGGGLVGSLLSTLLQKRGYQIQVFEKRSDPRKQQLSGGRSINLALSHRGIRTLKMAEVFDDVEPLLIPMYGRMVHVEGDLDFQPYGTNKQHINSVSRHDLNTKLIDSAEGQGVNFHFEAELKNVAPDTASVELTSGETHSFDFLIGADGAFSTLRRLINEEQSNFRTEEELLTHSYKELTIPSKNKQYAMDPNALHIWPRSNYMLIALPNPDQSFTCTLFLGDDGDPSFRQLKTNSDIESFLRNSFPDAFELMNDPVAQFHQNPTSSLQTIRTYPWVYKQSLLIGDAAHAIVPFYGQGMNAGFEDCRVFVELLESHNHDWERTAIAFQENRKRDTDAIADLALMNFLEMRAHVIDPEFLERKKLEKKLHETYPDEWLPLYSMVTFSDIPYHEALRLGKIQFEAIKSETANKNMLSPDLSKVLEAFKKLKKAPH